MNIAENYQFISVDEHKKLYKRCNPETNDILLRKVGVGARLACVVPENIFEFSIFVSVALVKCKVDKINPFFLSTFINTIYGQKQLIRFNKGITQPDLHLEEIRKLKVPIFKSSFQKKIEQIVRYSQKLREVASYLYQETENLLLSELNLKDWQPTEENIAVKSFKESFLSCDRLDAEYYQPKYDQAEKVIKDCGFPTQKLGSLIEPIQNGFDYREYTEEGTPYIRVGDVKNGLINLESAVKIPISMADVNKPVGLQLGDILFTRKGSFGNSA
ncbi:MAG: hypothetical protein ACKPEZ_01025, partial [Planktothrix sp.]